METDCAAVAAAPLRGFDFWLLVRKLPPTPSTPKIKRKVLLTLATRNQQETQNNVCLFFWMNRPNMVTFGWRSTSLCLKKWCQKCWIAFTVHLLPSLQLCCFRIIPILWVPSRTTVALLSPLWVMSLQGRWNQFHWKRHLHGDNFLKISTSGSKAATVAMNESRVVAALTKSPCSRKPKNPLVEFSSFDSGVFSACLILFLFSKNHHRFSWLFVPIKWSLSFEKC